MFSTLLSPTERDADHPAHGRMFPAFAVQDRVAHRHRLVAAGAGALALSVVWWLVAALR